MEVVNSELDLTIQLNYLLHIASTIFKHATQHPELVIRNVPTLTFYNMTLSKTSDIISNLREFIANPNLGQNGGRT